MQINEGLPAYIVVGARAALRRPPGQDGRHPRDGVQVRVGRHPGIPVATSCASCCHGQVLAWCARTPTSATTGSRRSIASSTRATSSSSARRTRRTGTADRGQGRGRCLGRHGRRHQALSGTSPPKMDRSAFAHMAATETTHWWFVGRRSGRSMRSSIRSTLPQDGTILEAGCGTGGNLATLAGADGSRPSSRTSTRSPSHRTATRTSTSASRRLALRPCRMTMGRSTWSRRLDVLEHVRGRSCVSASARQPGSARWLADRHAFRRTRRCRGTHDRRLHHLRRYGQRQLLDLFAGCDVDLVRTTPFNIVLSPLAIVYRVGERSLGIDLGNQERILPGRSTPPSACCSVSNSCWSAGASAIPFGLSYAAVFRRRT